MGTLKVEELKAALRGVRQYLETLEALVARFEAAPPVQLPASADSGEPLAWGAKMPAGLKQRIILTGQDFGFEPDWLAACIAFETMETFRADIRPRRKDGSLVSSAVGLIQFLEATAKGLGTTTAALAKMDPVRQFDFVWLYFRNSIKTFGPVKSLEDCYMHIHWPAAVGKPLSATMYARGSAAYAANAGLDLDRNSIITKAEAGALVRDKLIKGLKPGYVG